MRNLRKVTLTIFAETRLLPVEDLMANELEEVAMNQLVLSDRMREVLDRVRHQPRVLSVFEMPADLAEAADGQ